MGRGSEHKLVQRVMAHRAWGNCRGERSSLGSIAKQLRSECHHAEIFSIIEGARARSKSLYTIVKSLFSWTQVTIVQTLNKSENLCMHQVKILHPNAWGQPVRESAAKPTQTSLYLCLCTHVAQTYACDQRQEVHVDPASILCTPQAQRQKETTAWGFLVIFNSSSVWLCSAAGALQVPMVLSKRQTDDNRCALRDLIGQEQAITVLQCGLN